MAKGPVPRRSVGAVDTTLPTWQSGPMGEATDGAGAHGWERARRALDGVGLPPGSLAGRRTLSGGTYNAVEELLLVDGTRYVLKVPPPDTAPALAYERQLLVSEAEFYRRAATVGVPAPRVVGDRRDGHLLMTHCPGDPWEICPSVNAGHCSGSWGAWWPACTR